MPTELPKQYDPKEAQQKWLAFWDQRKYWHSRPDAREPYTIVIPPPNVTGALHMGHALNNTLQDVLIRWRRMQGYNAEWMPGTDHAGIATQAVVEKLIFQQEKKTRRDLGREELVRRIWEWKDKYEARILGQLKQLGCSCDWDRTRFTLDEGNNRAVRTTFFNWFRDGYIFRGKRLVNWDTQLQTSVADDETYTEETKSGFWTFKYPVTDESRSGEPSRTSDEGRSGEPSRTSDERRSGEPSRTSDDSRSGEPSRTSDDSRSGEPSRTSAGQGPASAARLAAPTEFISFSTTRPETMLGDTAVCVHPSDERYKHLIGKHVLQPLTGRQIPVIADGLLAKPELGTGCVKVTPAHDHNDYACYQRHPEIGIINILNPDGTINENGGKFAGLDRVKAREAVTKEMEALGLFEGREDRVIPLAYSDRSKTPIEPYLSDQWFVRMGDVEERGTRNAERGTESKPGLARRAMEAVLDGRVKFFPERYAQTYLDWLSEKRDWCISRQLWWGHRIPVWRLRVSASATDDEWNAAFHWSDVDEMFPDETGEYAVQLIDLETGDKLIPQSNELEAVDAFRGKNLEILLCKRRGDWNLGYIEMLEKMGFKQDPDVLDTWFSSQLWPHATFGWPDDTPELRYYYPGSTLVTTRDIITLWVARMVLSGLYNMGEVPFRHVYITPKLLDGFGVTMSKSKGNGVDPLDIIELYGTDALRYQMVFLAGETQDSRMPVSNICPHCAEQVPVKQEHMYLRTAKLNCPKCKQPFRPGGPWPSDDPNLPTAKQGSKDFEVGRNFANKLWNAARMVLLNLDGYRPEALRVEDLPTEDRWIISRLASVTKQVTDSLEGFRFSEVARTLYDFTWSEFCDWYLEMSKGRLKDDASRPLAQRMLVGVLDSILRLIHPVMPFVSESIWQALNEAAFERGLPEPQPSAESVMIAAWPKFPDSWQDAAVEGRIARMQELVRAVREVRNQFMVGERESLAVSVRCPAETARDFESLRPFLAQLAGVGEFNSGPDVAKPPQSASKVLGGFTLYVSLAGLIDPAKEQARLEKQLADKQKLIQSKEAKLGSEAFVARAPADVVQQERDAVAELRRQIAALEENLRDLSA